MKRDAGDVAYGPGHETYGHTLLFTPLAIYSSLVICFNSYQQKAQGGWFSTALSKAPSSCQICVLTSQEGS